MMYGGFDVFKTYLAVKNHFTTDYDYNKYGGRVTAKLESFTKRPDRYFFHKLSKRYNQRDILDYFVANFAVMFSHSCTVFLPGLKGFSILSILRLVIKEATCL